MDPRRRKNKLCGKQRKAALPKNGEAQFLLVSLGCDTHFEDKSYDSEGQRTGTQSQCIPSSPAATLQHPTCQSSWVLETQEKLQVKK